MSVALFSLERRVIAANFPQIRRAFTEFFSVLTLWFNCSDSPQSGCNVAR
jgi:hypothetical protein